MDGLIRVRMILDLTWSSFGDLIIIMIVVAVCEFVDLDGRSAHGLSLNMVLLNLFIFIFYSWPLASERDVCV